MSLFDFLANKPLFYDVIDTKRMPKIYASITHHLKIPKIIQVVGTNGKGTTGRFLAHMLYQQGLHVGHYTSPHIMTFNERIWVDGKDVSHFSLENAHMQLMIWLSHEDSQSLSYFEYTTLLAMVIFSEHCDYVVLEAGMGGEYDATTVFPKILSLITPIGYDHQAFLGNTIGAITQTKLNSVTTNFVLAKQYEAEVYGLALQKACEIDKKIFYVDGFFDAKKEKEIDLFVLQHGYSSFLGENFKAALCALTVLGYDIVLQNFDAPLLQGRCQRFLQNVTIDVGHNVMAAHALVKHFGEKKVILVYNCYSDKAYNEILSVLKPILLSLEIIAIESPRAVNQEALKETAIALGIKVDIFSDIKEDKEYLIFGSFSVVEAFLKGRCEK
ncbi:MAG: Mur ligase family protein [Sulfurospirillaceae bacterium]|nr:Mur ligase family protein [Sulfurospirillaceae bacterium]MDD2827614.1 Mur ligase family protein [Sulfurospirillaceae bacterium]